MILGAIWHREMMWNKQTGNSGERRELAWERE